MARLAGIELLAAHADVDGRRGRLAIVGISSDGGAGVRLNRAEGDLEVDRRASGPPRLECADHVVLGDAAGLQAVAALP